MAKKGTDQVGNGRPTSLTQARQEAIYQTIAMGTEYRDAALLHGVSSETLHRWLRTATRALPKQRSACSAFERRCMDFRAAVTTAEAEYRKNAEARIDIAATVGRTRTIVREVVNDKGTTRTTTTEQLAPDWRAAAWRLERRFPDRYGERSAVEITGAEGGPVEVTLAEVMDKVHRIREARGVSADEGTLDPPEGAQ